MRRLLLVGLALSLSCDGKKGDDTGVVLAVGPELEHPAPDAGLVEGAPLDLRVSASDEDGVRDVVLFHRTTDSTYWDSTPMDASDGSVWVATLDELHAPGLQYYFRGTDSGTPAGVSFLPADGAAAPFEVDVAAESLPLPWTEDFEQDEGATSLFIMGWWTPNDAFNGYPFQLTQNRAYGGETSAYHPRGTAGVGELQDWLISPALDLSTLPAAMVTWQEQGVSVAQIGTHGLYISTTSRDPAEGGFTAVNDVLDAPTDREWGRSKAADLSEWAGESQVYLAWRYVGDTADDWYIDDISVSALTADLTGSLLWLPDPVGPGEQAAITVVLLNETEADGTGLTATLTLPDGGGVVVEETVDVDDIPGGSSGQADFLLDLDSSLDNNRYLPLHVDVTDGDQTWPFDLQMTVGLPSTATVDLVVDAAASVNVTVGVGSPDDPVASMTAWAGLLPEGEHTIAVDVTDWYDLMPPAAGEQRWFAQVGADVDGSVDGFVVTYGGEDFAATTLPSFSSATTALVYAPEPPNPVLTSSTPTSASPGDTGLPVTLVLRNAGNATAGPVTGELVALDGDVSVSSGSTFTVDADIWQAGETQVISGPTVDISAAHSDSTPARFEVLLTDDVESWTVDVSIATPWPVLKIIGIEVDDDGGDGILDPGEAATLSLDVVNTGDMSTFSPVTGVLSAASTSTAVTTITSADGSFGRLTSGSSRDDDFELAVTGGAAGDTLDLVLNLEDDTAEYVATAQIILGEPPWLSLTPRDDDQSDNVGGYGFDFVNGRYRVVGTTVELWLESAVPIDPATLFIEAWGNASGADFTYYRWVLQSGSGTFQGYTSSAGFQTIGTVSAEFPGNDDVILSWDADDMGLLSDGFRIGLAAGWCGPPEYYCDHFPNGWGYPYSSGFYTSSWYDIRW
jgi:hypothetical protein